MFFQPMLWSRIENGELFIFQLLKKSWCKLEKVMNKVKLKLRTL